MGQVEVREGARRQHRVIGLFAVLQCWLRDIDGIVIERRHLERLIGLKRFKDSRQDWLKEDLFDYFNYQTMLVTNTSSQSLAGLFLSRKPFDSFFPHGAMNSAERIKQITVNGGPRFEIFDIWDTIKFADWNDDNRLLPFKTHINTDEALLTAYLTILAQGQIPISDIRRLLEKKKATIVKP